MEILYYTGAREDRRKALQEIRKTLGKSRFDRLDHTTLRVVCYYPYDTEIIQEIAEKNALTLQSRQLSVNPYQIPD